MRRGALPHDLHDVLDVRHRGYDGLPEFARQSLAHNLQVQQSQETASKPEAQSMRLFRRKGERRVVETEFLERRPQLAEPIGIGGIQGHLQLNTMQPLIARNLLEQIHLLANGVAVFDGSLLKDLAPVREKIEGNMERSLGLATLLVPRIGYDRAAEIARLAEAEGKTVRQVVKEQGVVAEDLLDRLILNSL